MSVTAEVREVLRHAADLIEPDGAWTQDRFARGKSGRVVSHIGRAAVCWCMAGALSRVASEEKVYYAALEAVQDHLGRSPIAWNDAPGRTQAEVVAALRGAAGSFDREALVKRPEG